MGNACHKASKPANNPTYAPKDPPHQKYSLFNQTVIPNTNPIPQNPVFNAYPSNFQKPLSEVINPPKDPSILKETPQYSPPFERVPLEYWELKTFEDIFQRLSGPLLNESLKKGEELDAILELIPFGNDIKIYKELIVKLAEKIVQEYFSSESKGPIGLIKALEFLNKDLLNSIKEYYGLTSCIETLSDVKGQLRIVVEFYQISSCFIRNNIQNEKEKWWGSDIHCFEGFLSQFNEILDKIKEKQQSSTERIEESPLKAPKSFMNYDIEGEFKKLETQNQNNECLWDKCEITEDFEGIELKINYQEYVPKVTRKTIKKP